MSFQSRYAVLHGREVHYTEWGDRKADTIVMWHGLARTSRDFDLLAAHMSKRYHVVCPDTIGRGLSQWSPAPETEYCLSFYGKLAEALVDSLGKKTIRWVGTSMGGGIGTYVAGGALRERITHLILNDIGPKINPAAVERIRAYAGNPPRFDTMVELENFFRTVYKPFGPLIDADWRHLTETSVRRTDDGKVTPHYDPKMVLQFVHHPEDYDLWTVYDRITAKTMCIRGAETDLLLADTAEEMTRRGPRCRLVNLPGIGHAPAFNTPDQIKLVEEFLAG